MRILGMIYHTFIFSIKEIELQKILYGVLT
jgi:hypothetical protein